MLFFWKLSSPKLPGWSSLSHNWKCRCIRIFGHSNILLCQPWWVWASLWKPVTLSHPLIKLCSSFFQVPIRSSHDFLKAYIVGKKTSWFLQLLVWCLYIILFFHVPHMTTSQTQIKRTALLARSNRSISGTKWTSATRLAACDPMEIVIYTVDILCTYLYYIYIIWNIYIDLHIFTYWL